MKALLLYGPRDARVEEVPEPEVPEGWCLIKTICVGICGTDKAFYLGTYPLFKKPLILGHEVVGIVVKGCSELKGKPVVPEINFACMKCPACISGLYTHCPNKRTLGIDFDGGFAEYFVAPTRMLHVVERLDPELAVFIEPLAALVHGLRMYPIEIGSKCAIIGTGTLAYMLAQLLRYLGAEVYVIARSDSVKARIISRNLGVEVLRVQKAKEMSFDTVFDVSGSTQALDLAIEIAKPRGLIHVKSTPGGAFSIDMTKAVVKELRIVGTRCGTYNDFELAKHLLMRKIVTPPPIEKIVGIDRGVEALNIALRRDVFKVVVFT